MLIENCEEYLKQRLKELDRVIEDAKKGKLYKFICLSTLLLKDQKNIISDMMEIIKMIDFNFH
jgi:hypothetical protein